MQPTRGTAFGPSTRCVSPLWAFHASTDGTWWRLLRYFTLGLELVRVGFLAQSPTGEGCAATFDHVTFGYNPERPVLHDIKGRSRVPAVVRVNYNNGVDAGGPGIGVLGQASAMSQEMFPGHITPVAAAGFVGLMSLFNMGGRFFWASTSDYIGRRNTWFAISGTVVVISLGAIAIGRIQSCMICATRSWPRCAARNFGAPVTAEL